MSVHDPADPRRGRLRSQWPILVILTLFLLVGGAYAVINPLHEATDELRHYRFVRTLVVDKTLPVQGEEPCRSQSHHPPLFYLVAALATAAIDGGDICATPPTNPFWQYRYWEVGVDNKAQFFHGPAEAFPWRGDALAAHVARGVNLLFGALTVWLTWAIGLAIWPRRRDIAALGAAVVAFNPMFIYLAAAINNDIIAAAAGAAITLALARLLRDPRGLTSRQGIVVGLLYGLGLLSKTSLLAFALPIALTATWIGWRRRQWRAWVAFGLLAVGAAALVSGWWFVRNMLVYGDPTGFQRLTELWGVRNPAESLPLVLTELPYAWTTLWGRFGFGQIPLPDVIYRALLVVCGLGVAAWLALLVPRARRHFPGAWPATALLLGVVVTSLLVWFNYMLVSPAGPMGRFFFPGLPALALLLAAGLLTPLGALDARRGPATLALLGSGGFFTLALLALLLYLRPAYVQPLGFDERRIGTEVTPSGARFDTLVQLDGYRLQTEGDAPLQPGGVLTVNLYLEVLAQPPGDYVFFAHLLDSAGTLVAQRDTYSGLGRFPSSQWRAGDRFIETVRIHLPETIAAPETLALQVGFYAPDAYRLAVWGAGDTFLGDALPLGDPLPLAAGPPLGISFENQLALQAVDYSARVLAPGATLDVALTWSQAGPDAPLEARLDLLDEQGNLRQRIAGRIEPSAFGVPAQILSVPLPTDLQPGQLRVLLAVVDPADQRLLNVIGEDGRWITAQVDLPPIRIATP